MSFKVNDLVIVKKSVFSKIIGHTFRVIEVNNYTKYKYYCKSEEGLNLFGSISFREEQLRLRPDPNELLKEIL